VVVVDKLVVQFVVVENVVLLLVEMLVFHSVDQVVVVDKLVVHCVTVENEVL
jgi:hypothetical protein